MVVENSKKIKRITRLFYLGAVIMALASLVFFLLGHDVPGFIAAGLVIIWFLVFQTADFQYLYFEISEGKLILRYYQAVKFGRKDYSGIEFPVSTLYEYHFEKSFFGLVYDLVIAVKTKKGVAEYPPVSFAAVSKKERVLVEEILKNLLKK